MKLPVLQITGYANHDRNGCRFGRPVFAFELRRTDNKISVLFLCRIMLDAIQTFVYFIGIIQLADIKLSLPGRNNILQIRQLVYGDLLAFFPC